jgi:cation transport ATPase
MRRALSTRLPKLGITEVYGEVLPHQKSELVKRLQADGKRVLRWSVTASTMRQL